MDFAGGRAKTLQPILFPQKSRARVQTICLDPGHGGKDKGEIAGGNFEKKYNLLLALAVEKLLRRKVSRWFSPAPTMLFRPPGPARPGGQGGRRPVCQPPLQLRAPVAPRRRSPLPASRRDEIQQCGGAAAGDPLPATPEDDRNILLAYHVLKSITATLPFEDIGVKREHYEVLKEARMPAILVEGGFMTDPQDAKKIYDAEFRQRMARSIVDGIVAYKKAVEDNIPVAVPGNSHRKQCVTDG